MKTTPTVNGQDKNGKVQEAKTYKIEEGKAVPVSELLKQAKTELEAQKAAKTDVTHVLADTTDPASPVVIAESRFVDIDAPEPAAPQLASVTPPSRSRADEITYQIEKANKMTLLNAQLQSLRNKFSDLKNFSYDVDRDDNHQYGRFVIYDDNNREFSCKHHGLTVLVVEYLKAQFAAKIAEKEEELLTVSRS